MSPVVFSADSAHKVHPEHFCSTFPPSWETGTEEFLASSDAVCASPESDENIHAPCSISILLCHRLLQSTSYLLLRESSKSKIKLVWFIAAPIMRSSQLKGSAVSTAEESWLARCELIELRLARWEFTEERGGAGDSFS
jgi:hypothetical protein